MQLYALHEIEAAVVMYKAVVKYKASTSATKALDEWWVFYAGSLEDGTNSGAGPYILPEKRSKFFGKHLFPATFLPYDESTSCFFSTERGVVSS